jgi:HK97 family phage portal protein
MRFLGFDITRRSADGPTVLDLQEKALVPSSSVLTSVPGSSWSGGWHRIMESYAGAWQQNVEVQLADVLTYSALYGLITLIGSDVGKLRPMLVEQDANGIWTETENAAHSPVLRKPNHYQNRIKFYEQWIVSKLVHGNTYVLKVRDASRIVRAMYILDPTRVRPMVAPNGDVYYAIHPDNLSLVSKADMVPASEIIHDVCVPLYHPLVGVSPITACGVAAVQGLKIQENSTLFFSNGSHPGGILTAPGRISQVQADTLKTTWETNYSGANFGKVAVLGDGLKYEQMSVNALDAQLVEQLKMTGEQCCTAFHVPPYMVGIGDPPNYNNIEALNQQYYSQCLQNLIECIELLLDEGLELPRAPRVLGTEFDLTDLLRMDTATRVAAAEKAISAGMAIDEARRRFYGLGPTPGGNVVYLQQQNYSLPALAKRDASADPFGTAKPPAPAPADPEPDDEEEEDDEDVERAALEFMRKELAA